MSDEELTKGMEVMRNYWCGRCRKTQSFSKLIHFELGEEKEEIQFRCGKCGQHIYSEYKPLVFGKYGVMIRLKKRSDCELLATKLDELGKTNDTGVEMRYEVDDVSSEEEY